MPVQPADFSGKARSQQAIHQGVTGGEVGFLCVRHTGHPFLHCLGVVISPVLREGFRHPIDGAGNAVVGQDPRQGISIPAVVSPAGEDAHRPLPLGCLVHPHGSPVHQGLAGNKVCNGVGITFSHGGNRNNRLHGGSSYPFLAFALRLLDWFQYTPPLSPQQEKVLSSHRFLHRSYHRNQIKTKVWYASWEVVV